MRSEVKIEVVESPAGNGKQLIYLTIDGIRFACTADTLEASMTLAWRIARALGVEVL